MLSVVFLVRLPNCFLTKSKCSLVWRGIWILNVISFDVCTEKIRLSNMLVMEAYSRDIATCLSYETEGACNVPHFWRWLTSQQDLSVTMLDINQFESVFSFNAEYAYSNATHHQIQNNRRTLHNKLYFDRLVDVLQVKSTKFSVNLFIPVISYTKIT